MAECNCNPKHAVTYEERQAARKRLRDAQMLCNLSEIIEASRLLGFCPTNPNPDLVAPKPVAAPVPVAAPQPKPELAKTDSQPKRAKSSRR